MRELKIFVSCHKPSKVAKEDCLYPIQVGCYYSKNRIKDFLCDDEGDNISEKNKRYCELTAQYYAWKNVETDYYGFFHYRRYFNFDMENKLREDEWGNIVYKCIEDDIVEKLSIKKDKILDLLERYDVLTTKKRDLTKAPDADKHITVYKEYVKQSHQHEKDLQNLIRVIKEKYPEFAHIVDSYMLGNEAYECNMFIMPKEVFRSYSSWLFDILFEVEKYIGFEKYDIEETRVMGFLAERACGIYIEYLKAQGMRIGELQKTIFLDTTDVEVSGFCEDGGIPIALSANNKFAPYLSIFIKSLAENNIGNKLNIYILHQDIKAETQKNICIDNNYKHISMRFIDVKSYFADLNLHIDQHLSLETYFRLVIQDIFKDYKKILYLDSDMVALSDIKELYETDINDYAIAAVKDIEYAGVCKLRKEAVEYAKETLKLKDEYDYLQAGVLVLNLEKMRQLYSVKELLDIAGSYKWQHHDQDVLNFAYRGNIKYLPQEWNVMMIWRKNNLSRMDILKKAPLGIYEEYMMARTKPRIIHFAGYQKPWNEEDCDYAEVFWEYARKSIYYEHLLRGLLEKGKKRKDEVFGMKDKLYQVFNLIFPLYSKRRDMARKIYRSFVRT